MKTTKIIISSVASTLIVSAIVYAATISGVGPQTINSGDTVGNGWFQQANDQIAAAAPTGAISAFYLSTCPTGWIIADGTNSTPDLRGKFVRGIDSSGIFDSTRALGDYQADAFQGHKHSLAGLQNTVLNAGSTHWNDAPGYSDTWSSLLIGTPIGDGVNGTPRTGNETRPKNIALLYCMKQ